MSTEASSAHGSDQPETADAVPAEPTGPAADTRARFREALERKRSRQAAGASGVPTDPKSQGTHGAAGGKRVFRRKSG